MFDNEGVFCWEDESHSTAFMSAKDVIDCFCEIPTRKTNANLFYPSMKVLQ